MKYKIFTFSILAILIADLTLCFVAYLPSKYLFLYKSKYFDMFEYLFFLREVLIFFLIGILGYVLLLLKNNKAIYFIISYIAYQIIKKISGTSFDTIAIIKILSLIFVLFSFFSKEVLAYFSITKLRLLKLFIFISVLDFLLLISISQLR